MAPDAPSLARVYTGHANPKTVILRVDSRLEFNRHDTLVGRDLGLVVLNHHPRRIPLEILIYQSVTLSKVDLALKQGILLVPLGTRVYCKLIYQQFTYCVYFG